jgi:DNA invertase Pin-like site-specific DNA recombinase
MATSKQAQQATAYYVRVSSQSQDIRSQIPEMETHAQGHDPVRWYRDTFTGSQMERPGWDKLMTDLRAGLIRQIVIWRLDRLGRTTSGLVNLLEELRDRKVGLVSLRDGALDPTTPTGRLIYTILSSVATYETEVRKERQLAGIQAVRKRNGGKCPWGGSQVGRRIKVTVQKEELIRKLRAEGHKVVTIARLVGLTRQTCYTVLKRRPIRLTHR